MLSATSLAAYVAQRPKIVGLLQKPSAARGGKHEQTALSPEEPPVSTQPADGGHTRVTHKKPALKLPCWTFGKQTLPTPESRGRISKLLQGKVLAFSCYPSGYLLVYTASAP